jgi:hypothetical protein
VFNGCARYRKCKLLCEDGVATRRQRTFVERHEADCADCARQHALTMSALGALRSAAIEPQPDPGFESRFIRVWRIERRSRAVSYWMPAVAGAVVAGVALLAVLQILFSSPARENADLKNREARGPVLPTHSEAFTIDLTK